MELNIRQLRMLQEVASRGTIAAAADALGYTPSAVSQQLGALERETGVAVLERVGRNVRLTDAGRELVSHARVVMTNLEAARAALERVGGTPQGTVEISVFESVAATLLPPMLQILGETAPELRVVTRQMDPDAALEHLVNGSLDLAFILHYPHAPGPQPPDITRHHISMDRFHLVLPEDDPLAVETRVSLARVADREFVASPPDLSCGRCIVQACRDAGFEPTITHQIDDYSTAMRLVAGGAGVALIPDLGLVHAPAGIATVNLTESLYREITLAYRDASSQRPAVQAVCAALDAVAQVLQLDRATMPSS